MLRRLVPALFLLLCALPLFAQETIFLVRHAEKNSDADNALLSPAGHVRAECLARTLADANISKIYATDIERTQQTAAPAADALKIKTNIIPKKNVSELVKDLKQAGSANVLVVNHSDTLPKIIEQLGGGGVKLSASDYDRLFIITRMNNGKAKLVTLHYCDHP